MRLSVGIIGLPNVGKSTTFNALINAQNAQAANYPFCTIEPNKATVPVLDSRINNLAKIVNPQAIHYSLIEFVDIAGLVRGASKGEGLANQFLSHIKEVDAILHIVRCFEDSNITHVEGRVNPIGDIEIIEMELILSDILSLERRITRLEKESKINKNISKIIDIARLLFKHLENNNPASSFELRDKEEFILLDKELRLLSNKALIYGANVDEKSLVDNNKYVDALFEYGKLKNVEVVKICSKIEEDMIGLSEEERKEFLESLGVEDSGLNQVIKLGFKKLGLINYFTAGIKEVRSWTIKDGYKAPKAASIIHNDFERGFIRAEVISYSDFIKYNGEAGAKKAGVMRSEGKDYIVKDGDVMHFRFNV